MAKPFVYETWQSLEQSVGKVVRTVCDELVDLNLQEEFDASPLNTMGFKDMVASFDMGWQGRKSGNSYNSASGFASFMGARMRKVMARCVKSKLCSTCAAAMARNVEPALHDCTLNHEGSSKAMEAAAAVELLVEIHDKGKTLKRMVGDDDSTFKANIKHSRLLMLNDENHPFTAKDWPRTASGARKKDTGKLPLHIPQVEEDLADPTHRTRVFARPLYEQAKKPKATNPHGLHTGDAERLKTNHGYFLKFYRHKPFDVFAHRSKAVIEHHFNNHEFCGEWCRFSKDLPDNIRKEKPGPKDGRYRCKIQNAELYKLVRGLTDRFFTDERLRESHHMFDSQANEALNNMISKFAPKNRVYCRTPSLQARVGMAVSIHSVGIEEFIDRVGTKSGFSPPNLNSRQFLQKRDREKAYIGEYKKRIDVKGRRSKAKKRKQAAEVIADAAAKRAGTYYGSGMAILAPEEEPPKKKQATTAATKRVTRACSKCGEFGHRCDSIKKCKKHPQYQSGKGELAFSARRKMCINIYSIF